MKPVLNLPPECQSPSSYISYIPALNMRIEGELTGDWHSNMFSVENFAVEPYMLAGDIGDFNTNEALEKLGVRDMLPFLSNYFTIEHSAVYAANHYRAIADLIYKSVMVDTEMRSNLADLQTICQWLDSDEEIKILRDQYLSPLQYYIDDEQKFNAFANFLKKNFGKNKWFT